ncbi:MAG: hypothetical protein K5770_02875 [Lachnospiraceae bacterium]|nr:hypothetical protein [Lachnospiraceae bacterium]
MRADLFKRILTALIMVIMMTGLLGLTAFAGDQTFVDNGNGSAPVLLEGGAVSSDYWVYLPAAIALRRDENTGESLTYSNTFNIKVSGLLLGADKAILIKPSATMTGSEETENCLEGSFIMKEQEGDTDKAGGDTAKAHICFANDKTGRTDGYVKFYSSEKEGEVTGANEIKLADNTGNKATARVSSGKIVATGFDASAEYKGTASFAWTLK